MKTEPRSVASNVNRGNSNAGRISVVIPAYNASAFLPATLQSVLDQSLPPGEIIVVDDGSTDDTAAIATAFGARVISVVNGGPSAARNVGTRAACGEYIAFLDADDLWVREKLEAQLAALEAYGLPAFGFTDFTKFNERGRQRPSELRHHWAFRKATKKSDGNGNIIIAADAKNPVLYDSYIPPSTLLVRRADILAVGGFNETLRVAEDFEFYLRLLKRVPAVAVMRPLLEYRQHALQATANGTAMKAGFFDVARLVAAEPGRYPEADAKHILGADYSRYRTLGVEQARIGRFNEAILSFEQSLAARWSAAAQLGYWASLACQSTWGRRTFDAIRSTWKRRPGKL
jgi:glycosyltransferase involved in cell wall biosynthesis